jgi:hypothetical protein
MTKHSIYAAWQHAKDMYGLEISQDTFETYAMSAFLKIGNKDCRMYRTKLHPVQDPDGGWSVEKPCNLDAIEAITTNYEDFQDMTTINYHQGVYNHFVEERIESRKSNTSDYYIPGKLVKYTEANDKIYFSEPYSELNLLYKGWFTDENGYPYLNEKEVEAIALYCAYSDHFKKGLVSKDNSEIQLANLLKKDWIQACKSARVPQDISQNSLNEIMDTFVRRDVHRFGKTYKLVL